MIPPKKYEGSQVGSSSSGSGSGSGSSRFSSRNFVLFFVGCISLTVCVGTNYYFYAIIASGTAANMHWKEPKNHTETAASQPFLQQQLQVHELQQQPQQQPQQQQQVTNHTTIPILPNPKETTNAVATTSTGTKPEQIKNEQILFVHIGKTGGETIKQVLLQPCLTRTNKRNQHPCQHLQEEESLLSQFTFGYFHCNHMLPRHAERIATTYLYSLRHPLDRTLSWYEYMNPHNCFKNARSTTTTGCVTKQLIRTPTTNTSSSSSFSLLGKQFFDCFPTRKNLTSSLLLSPFIRNHNHTRRNEHDLFCTQLAWSTLRGNRENYNPPASGIFNDRIFVHLNANIEYYYQETINKYESYRRDKKVMIIRTDYLWEDLRDMDEYYYTRQQDDDTKNPRNAIFHSQLFGTRINANNLTSYSYSDNTINGAVGRSLTVHKKEHSSSSSSLSSTLTKHEKQVLCCALKKELFIYRALIQMSANLNSAIKNQTLQETIYHCNYNSWDELENDEQC